jgi:uncharacterized protein YggE
MIPLYLDPDFQPASEQDVKMMKQQILALDMSLSKLSSDLESSIVRVRTDQAVNNRRMKEMIDQLRKEMLERQHIKTSNTIDSNEVSNEESTTLSSEKKCNSE